MNRQLEQGLTLIEVLAALAIFAIVAVSVLALFPTVVKLNTKTRADQAVTIGARQFMEDTRINYSTKAGFDTGTIASKPSKASVNNYDCQTAVSEVQKNAAGTVIIKRVTLTCTHTSQPEQTFVLDLARPS